MMRRAATALYAYAAQGGVWSHPRPRFAEARIQTGQITFTTNTGDLMAVGVLYTISNDTA